MRKQVQAYCGLHCEGCSVYVASHFNKERLKVIAAKMNVTVDEMYCDGCRAEVVAKHCRSCEIKACAIEKDIDSCAYCKAMPCDILKEFRCKMPHRAEIIESLEYLKLHGEDEWEVKMHEDLECGICGNMNSPYYIRCRVCGNVPANMFTNRHFETLMEYVKKIGN